MCGKSRRWVHLLLGVVKPLPVIVTLITFVWGWYAYTFHVTRISKQSTQRKLVYLTIGHVLYILSLWSYVQTVFTRGARIPSKFFVSPEMSEEMIKAPTEQQRNNILLYMIKRNDLPVYCRGYSGAIRYCDVCNLIKPDRSHHCSVCRRCLLKMDHHCPWVNNCVSFTNYKFFVLTLGYTMVLSFFVAITAYPYFHAIWLAEDASEYFKTDTLLFDQTSQQPEFEENSSLPPNNETTAASHVVPFIVRFHIFSLFFVTSSLSLGVLFLFCYHVHLLLSNRTTLESFSAPLMMYGPDRNAFNLGCKENFLRLFGRNKFLWLLPVATTEGSGFAFGHRQFKPNIDEEASQQLLGVNQNNNIIDEKINLANHDTKV